MKNYSKLKFSSEVETDIKAEHSNPKRLQREVRNKIKQSGTSSKSQIALQQQREEMKMERKAYSKQNKELEKQKKFELKQEKRKQKHRGK